MKKFIVIIAMAVLSASALSARELTAEQAWSRVTGAKHTAQKMRGATSVTPKLVKTVNTDTGQPAYYIFNTGDCTVFASADDIAAPVLGYTDSKVADMDQIPPAMAYMLDMYAREIELAKSRGAVTAYTSTRANDWQSIEPLVTTKWDQGSPYNDLCPEKKGEKTYSGCVVTAMTQVMGYHRYPTIGHGIVSYTWNDQTLSTNLSESPIRWDDILPTYTEAEPGTETQQSAIASLTRDCGYAMHMNYGLTEDNGSKAQVYDMPAVLVKNYGYDKGVRCERHALYSQAEWEQMMYDELSASRPIVYAGHGDGGGHAFICDGYQGNGLFHINWGWSGKSDGYFALTALDPYDLGAGGGTGGFNMWQQAVVGIQLPQPGSVAPEPFIGSTTDIRGSAIDYKLKIKPIEDLSLKGAFNNLGNEEATFILGVKLVSDENGETIYLTDNKLINQSYGVDDGPAYIEVTVPSDKLGNYKAYPVYKYEGGDWKYVRLPYGGRDFIRLSVTPTRIDISPEDRSGTLTVVSCKVPSEFVMNQDYSIELVILNLTDMPQKYDCYAQIIDDDVPPYPYADLGDDEGTVEPKGTAMVTLSGKFDDSVITTEITPGEYNLIISCVGCENWEPKYKVTVSDTSSGIVNVEADKKPHELLMFDLSGRRVSYNNLVPGVYIKVSGATKEKVLIK